MHHTNTYTHRLQSDMFRVVSMSGHRVVNSNETHFYTATKHAVTALTEGLRQELRQKNSHIRVAVNITCFVFVLYSENYMTINGFAAKATQNNIHKQGQ